MTLGQFPCLPSWKTAEACHAAFEVLTVCRHCDSERNISAVEVLHQTQSLESTDRNCAGIVQGRLDVAALEVVAMAHQTFEFCWTVSSRIPTRHWPWTLLLATT